MSKNIEVSNSNRTFVLELLKQNTRLDGRDLKQFRDLEISIGDEYGYVDVKLGNTRCIVRISSEIVTPYEDRPFEGIFTINSEINSMASPIFENNRQSDDEIMISRLIEKAVRRSNAIDLESLCIIAGLKCWSIRCDVHFINYDGNFIDISCIGVMTALLHYKKKDVTVDGEQVILHPFEERNGVPLSILHIPICVTFSFYNPNDMEENIKGTLNNELVIVDSNMDEEVLRSGSLTLTLNKNREIIQINKAGGLSIDAMMIMDCSNLLYEIVRNITEKIISLVKLNDISNNSNKK